MYRVFKLKNNRLNNRDFNIVNIVNNRDYDFFPTIEQHLFWDLSVSHGAPGVAGLQVRGGGLVLVSGF